MIQHILNCIKLQNYSFEHKVIQHKVQSTTRKRRNQVICNRVGVTSKTSRKGTFSHDDHSDMSWHYIDTTLKPPTHSQLSHNPCPSNEQPTHKSSTSFSQITYNSPWILLKLYNYMLKMSATPMTFNRGHYILFSAKIDTVLSKLTWCLINEIEWLP